MNVDAAFGLASTAAAAGWLLLVAGWLLDGHRAPAAARAANAALWLGGRLVPVLLAAGYALAIARWWGAPGGFSSLDEVATLFGTRGLLLAGWVHFLAFDLWVGRWGLDALRATAAPGAPLGWPWRLAALPCLFATFMFGPVGLLGLLALLGLRRLARPQQAS